ncbi:hypothetical protein Q1695_000993 [Nippostrongylus brasiliensis]|nr:hypothetical protein Q1695_000993 [Nippostrongylus brasiliensis]
MDVPYRTIDDTRTLEQRRQQPDLITRENAGRIRFIELQKKWCKDNLHDFVSAEEWPPYSPDLNPMDYSIWSVLEAKACATPHRSLDCLKESLIKAWDEIDEDYLRRTIDAFPQRLHQCIVNGGDRVEQI